jgi:hypothetical protein
MKTSIADIRRMLDEVESEETTEQSEATLLLAEVPTLACYLSRRVSPSWRKLATEIRDEPDHWDSSYPPAEYVVASTRERLLKVYDPETKERDTSGGFYNTFQINTVEPGLAVGTDGTLYAIYETGSAKTSSYAAHPGTDHRDIHRSYRPIAAPGIDELRYAAELLRKMKAAVTAASPRQIIDDRSSVRNEVIAALHNPRLTVEDAQRAYDTVASKLVKEVALQRKWKLTEKARAAA